MDTYMISFIILLGFMFISRNINEKATQKLTPEKKVALIDLFSSGRVYTFGIMIGIIVLFFLSISLQWFHPLISYIIYLVLILAFMIITTYKSFKKLKANEFPDSFIKSYLISTSVRLMGLLIFFAFLFYSPS